MFRYVLNSETCLHTSESSINWVVLSCRTFNNCKICLYQRVFFSAFCHLTSRGRWFFCLICCPDILMLRIVIFQRSLSRLCNFLYTTTAKLLGLLLPKMLHSGLHPNSTKRTPSSRVDSSLARQEILLHLTENEGLLPCSKEPSHPIYLRSVLVLSCHLLLGFSSVLFRFLHQNRSCISLIPHTFHLLLDLIRQIISGELSKFESQHYAIFSILPFIPPLKAKYILKHPQPIYMETIQLCMLLNKPHLFSLRHYMFILIHLVTLTCMLHVRAPKILIVSSFCNTYICTYIPWIHKCGIKTAGYGTSHEYTKYTNSECNILQTLYKNSIIIHFYT